MNCRAVGPRAGRQQREDLVTGAQALVQGLGAVAARLARFRPPHWLCIV